MINILFFSEKNELSNSIVKVLSNEGYKFSISTGKVQIDLILKEFLPDIILIDSSITLISPLNLIKSIRNNIKTKEIPILLIIEENKINDLEQHVNLGIDEIIKKPVDVRYLSSRIKIVHRMFLSKDSNPLTGLPGNRSIEKNINLLIENQDKTKFAIVYGDLDNFKPYNDIYGFAKGDEVILFTSNLIKKALSLYGNADDFIGHIGGDDFIFITTADKVENVCNFICNEFDENIRNFYNENDKKNGYIIAKDREGNTKKFGFISISLSIITNEKRTFSSYLEISHLAAELKKFAKSQPKSKWVKDKRNGDKSSEENFIKNSPIGDRRNPKKIYNILVVDDSKFIVEVIKNILLLEGFQVETETDSEKALFLTEIKKYDLLILDISMPKIDGLTLISEIRKRKLNQNTPIIIISAYNQKNIILEAAKLGIKKYIVKPFDNKELVSIVQKYVEIQS
ncbi:MAG: response regulator [Spirochaetes bacterium]|nr:response regulator [Spirochaetota bacterium]